MCDWQKWKNPTGNPNRIKYQSYTGVWVNYTVKKTQKVVVLVDGDGTVIISLLTDDSDDSRREGSPANADQLTVGVAGRQ